MENNGTSQRVAAELKCLKGSLLKVPQSDLDLEIKEVIDLIISSYQYSGMFV